MKFGAAPNKHQGLMEDPSLTRLNMREDSMEFSDNYGPTGNSNGGAFTLRKGSRNSIHTN